MLPFATWCTQPPAVCAGHQQLTAEPFSGALTLAKWALPQLEDMLAHPSLRGGPQEIGIQKGGSHDSSEDQLCGILYAPEHPKRSD